MIRAKKILKNKTGFTMLVVMSFMLTSAMLGSSVVYVANQQTKTGADFYAKKTADDAAISSGEWFIGAIEDYTSSSSENRENLLNWLNNFDEDSDTKWYNGNSDLSSAFSASSIDSAATIRISDKNINAKIKIDNYDKSNGIMTIKAIGFGLNDSKKTMHFVYKLEGVQEKNINSYLPFNGAYLTYGFSAGKGFFSDKGFTVKNSGAYIGDDPSTSSVMHMNANIEGDVKIMNQKEIIIDQGFTFGGNLYINDDVQFNLTGDFGSDSGQYIFINGNSIFNQSINFNNNTYLMNISSNIGQNLTFNKKAYIKDNGATWNKATYFNDNAEILASGVVTHNGNPAFVIANSKTLKISNSIKENWMRDRVSGTCLESESSVPNLNKEDVLTVSEYSTHEEIDVDYQKMRDLVDNQNKGIRLSDMVNWPSGWDQDGDGKLDADDVDYLYSNNLIEKTENGVLTIIADDNDKIDFADNTHGTLDAGVKIAMVVDVDNLGYHYGSDWNIWETTMQPTSEESNEENSANFGIFVSEQGSLYESHMEVNNFRGMIHDEYNGMYFNKEINMQGAFITKQHLETKNPVSIDYENDAIGDFFDMGILLDPNTHNAYTPEGFDDQQLGASDSSINVIYTQFVKPKKLFEY